MPGSASDFLENKLLDHVLGPSANTYAKPASLWVALYTSDPSDAGPGAEVAGGSYSRKQITFGNASNGTILNNNNVEFTSMPACTVVAVGILTANTAGDLLFWSTLTTSRVLLVNDTIRINSGALSVSLS